MGRAVYSTQEDPIGVAGGLNLYGYGAGDPVNNSDPFGLCPAIPQLCTAALGALAAAAAQAAINVANERPIGEGMLRAAVIGGVAGLGLGIAAPSAAAGFAARGAALVSSGAATGVAGGAGAAAAASKLTIQFGRTANQVSHAMRHVVEAGLDPNSVRAAISQHLPTVASQIAPGSPLNQVISVGGQKLQYTAFPISEGVINVGRIHPVP